MRFTLKLGAEKFTDARMQQVWLAVDLDRSGWWNTKEFGHFMNQSERHIAERGGGKRQGAAVSLAPSDSTRRLRGRGGGRDDAWQHARP